VRPKVIETTALGSAFLAGLATGVWDRPEDIRRCWIPDRTFHPAMEPQAREACLTRWNRAVEIA